AFSEQSLRTQAVALRMRRTAHRACLDKLQRSLLPYRFDLCGVRGRGRLRLSDRGGVPRLGSQWSASLCAGRNPYLPADSICWTDLRLGKARSRMDQEGAGVSRTEIVPSMRKKCPF